MEARSGKIWIDIPSGASSCAARSNAVLKAAFRKLPEIANTWIVSSLINGLLAGLPEVALAVLSRVASLCADPCLFPMLGAGGNASSRWRALSRPILPMEKSDNKFGNPEQASHRVHP
jgi:hypothetical protein